jgi:putative ABC transport system substrate-binding protein
VLKLRSAEGRNERLPGLAAEVLKADPRVIVAFTAPATRVLQQATTTIPIVMWAVGDPVEYGLVASLARPGVG